MGAETSRLDATASSPPANQFATQVAEACDQDNHSKFRELWETVKRTRDDNHPDYDDGLCRADIMQTLKNALKKQDTEWRRTAIEIARTFFHNQKARDHLLKMDFITYLLVMTLPDEHEEEEDDDGRARDKEKTERANQLEAVATIRELAEYEDFTKPLCCTDVLNFLSIVLNQIEEAREIVTETFVRLSNNEEEQDNLVKLMEDSVGDVLESFFKTVEFKTGDDGDDERWRRNISALSNGAHTLGTLIKHKHQVRVYKPRILEVLRHIVDSDQKGISSDNMRLLAEMSRLLYWICRISNDVMETLHEASENLDEALAILKNVWENCAVTHQVPDDVKSHHTQMCLCHMNCLLWVLLPESQIRWRFKRLDLKRLHVAFDLRDPELLTVVLSTVRHLVDLPKAQECHDLIKFFGEQLLILLDQVQKEQIRHNRVITLLLNAVSILAMQRGMQEMLAAYDAWQALDRLLKRLPHLEERDVKKDVKKHQLSVLLTNAQVAMHPSHRLSWAARSADQNFMYPPRKLFEEKLNKMMEKDADENFRTIASLLLTTFREKEFRHPLAEIETTFKAHFDSWQQHTTARYDEERIAGESQGAAGTVRQSKGLRPLKDLLQCAITRREERRALTSTETLNYCDPYACVFALTLFSRLALEPKFKQLFTNDNALHSLLGCVCVGIWAEAREAAATLANLMWLPDLNEERLVCWLKFDGPKCVAVDAANVLIPVKEGNPRAADIGKGMYHSTWGVQFVEGSCVTLHPDGLKTWLVPGILTSASPLSTFENTSRSEYTWLDEASAPDEKHFTVTCWFYWPLNPQKDRVNKVLLQTSGAPRERIAQVYLDCETTQGDGAWTLTTENKESKKVRYQLKTPKLNAGWHMLSVVSSTNGTKFFLDTWKHELEKAWVRNEFYMVGNDAGTDDTGKGGKKPFFLMADFRIYARTLSDDEIRGMVHSRDTERHPDQIVRRLADLDAARILAQRLDVPDSAAECLRALGSLATLITQRAKIYSICGRQVLKMLDSPLPMIQRQAARLLNNMT
mmetsp:Transcript_65479/g.151998  ORF Transcript_65479/g.151998 Transcript_65479/m.151998 type:complete len:1031 (+) Transcript_65479:218-3310(+)